MRSRQSAFPVLAAVLVSVGHVAAADTEFTAEGEVEFYNFLAAEQVKAQVLNFAPVVSNAVHFSITVSNSCWLLRMTPQRSDEQYQYREAAFDGHHLYSLTYFGGKGGNVATAWIYDNQRVVYDVFAHEVGPIWLMLCSGSYFRSQTNDMVEPATILGLFEIQEYFKRPFKLHANWTLQDTFPFLPTRVSYWDDGEVKTDPQFPPYRRRAPFDRGFTNVTFVVHRFENYHGVLVPQVAHLDTFRPDPRGGPELVHYTHYQISLLQWSRTTTRVTFRPTLPGLTAISDARVFPQGGNYAYLSASNWLSLEDVTNTAKFKRAAQVVRDSSKRTDSQNRFRKRVRIVILSLLVVLLAPAVFVAVQNYKTRQLDRKG